MTEQPASTAETPPETSTRPRQDRSRRAAVLFVTIFVVCVLSMLTGYRYMLDSKANDWYLLQVAQHTSWLLGLIGHSSWVEDPREDPAWVRACIQSWEIGQEAPPEPAAGTVSAAAPSLTSWEAFHFRMLRMRYERDLLAKQVQELPAQRQAVLNDASLDDTTKARQLAELDRLTQRYTRMTTADNGPLVFFVFRPGYPARIRELQQQIKALGADPVAVSRKTELEAQLQQLELWQTFANRQRGLDMEKTSLESASFTDENKRAQKKADIEERQAQLERERQAAGGQGPDLPEQDVAFHFTLVPDCGAIPSIIIFLAAVLAFPARWWKRLVGLVGGIAILYCVNALLRLPCLAVIGALNGGGKWFDFAHHYVWQGIYIVFVVLVWLAWVEYIVRGKERGEDPAP